jgi:hypothetical protein
MSHHGSNPNPDPNSPPEVQRALSDAMRRLLGEHPNGKLNVDDAGAIAFAVGVEAGRVVLRFPKPVAWMGMTGDEALELAQLLIRHAKNAGITSPLVIRLG